MFRRGLYDQGGIQLLEDIAVALEEQAEELGNVMGDQVKLEAVPDFGYLDGFLFLVEPHHFL
jgi:hypothetical protein